MKGFASSVALALLVVLSLPFAGAQDITKGSIGGIVKDASGAVVAGASVTLSSAFGDKQTMTSSGGEYAFTNLTVGPGYAVQVEKMGFSTAKSTNLIVSLNQRTTADVSLQVGQTATTVEVTASGAGNVDLTSTTVGANISEDLYKNVAAGRNISSIVLFAPGVDDSGGAGFANPSINGASGLENQYVIDGADVTDPGYGGFGTYSRIFGSLGNGVNFDFVQEVQVKTGGFEAQYGAALGGIVNVITKSGSNSLHGSLYGYFAPEAFEAQRPNVNDQLTTKVTNTTHVASTDWGGDLGGPIKKDKLFFYGGANPTYGTTYILAEPTFANYALGVQNVKTTTYNYSGKINWNLSSKHTLEGTVFGDPASGPTQYNRGINTLKAGNPVDKLTQSSLDYGSRTWSGRYTGALTAKWVVTANYSDHSNHLTEFPSANGYRITDNTPTQNGSGGGAFTYGGLGTQENFDSKSHQVNATSSHIFSFFGGHALDFGFQMEDQPYNDILLTTGPNFQIPNLPEFGSAAGQTQVGAYLTRTYYLNKSTNPIVLKVTRGNYSNPTVAAGSRYYSGFIQDSWNLGKYITVKPGLRFEQQEMNGTYLRYVMSHNWAPRIGIIVDPTGSRKSKFFANWGRFYEKIPADISIRAFSFETSVIGALYKDPGSGNQPDLSPANYCGASTHPCGATVTGGTLGFSGDPSFAEIIAPGTGAEYQDEVIGGFEKEFGDKFTFSGRFVYRHMQRIVEDISGVNVTQYNLGVPQQYVISNPNAKLDIFHNFYPCTSGPNCDTDTGFTDLNQPILGSDGTPDGFPNPVRIYKSMELVASRRFSNGVQIYANYTLSKLFGNFQGSYRGDNGQTDPNISSLFDFTNSDGLLTGQFQPGVLPTDRTHQFKVFGNYTWKAVNVGISWRFLTGTPITKLNDHPAYLNSGEVPIGARGAYGRTPNQFPLDFHADYTLKVREHATVKLLADLFNVGNQVTASSIVQSAEVSGSPGVANVDFLHISAYTRPFYARLGVRFEF